ncbi:MAG: TetR/AcrR family transcriptional regulator [Clostridia bacterium]|nr:TetR/AcrR family transcriptional regulator [Clostridia bacterium]
MEINICSDHVKTKNGIKSDKRLLRTKKAIISALIELLTVKDISDITVTELTQKAGINRKTFYLHYDRIEDIITDFSADLYAFFDKVLSARTASDGSTDIGELFYAINRAITDNLEFFRCFVRSGAYHIFISSAMRRQYVNGIKVSLGEFFGNSVISPYAIEYVVSGVSAMYTKWLSTELPTISLDALSDCACELVLSSFRYLIGGEYE